MARRTRRVRRAGRAPPDREAHDEVDEALLGRDDRPVVRRRVAGPSAVAANVSRRSGSWTTPDDGAAVDDQGEGDAEERDPVGVVDGPVDRVADPRSVGGHGVPARLLAVEGVVREALGERRPDQRLGRVVHLGHDVADALEGDRAGVVEALHQEDAGAGGDLHRGRQLRGPGAPSAGHREQSTASERSAAPEPGDALLEDEVVPGRDLGRPDVGLHRRVARVGRVPDAAAGAGRPASRGSRRRR